MYMYLRVYVFICVCAYICALSGGKLGTHIKSLIFVKYLIYKQLKRYKALYSYHTDLYNHSRKSNVRFFVGEFFWKL